MILVFVGCESFFLMHEPAGVGKQWLKQYISFGGTTALLIGQGCTEIIPLFWRLRKVLLSDSPFLCANCDTDSS